MGCFFPAYGFSCGIYIRYLDIPPAVWYNIAIMGREIFFWRHRLARQPPPQKRNEIEEFAMLQKVLKTIVYAVVLLLCLLIVLRCCLNSDRSTLDDLVRTDALSAVLAADTEKKMAVRVLHENASELSSDGYFCAYGLMYIPEANELQCTVRYNRSVYEYNSIPEDTPFSFYLSVGASGEKLPLTVGASESKLMYEYRRLVLDGIELSDDTVLYCWMELTPGTYSNTAIKYAEQPFAVDMVRKPQS